MKVKLKIGDLVACYVTNTNEYESLMQWGIVIEVNEELNDIMVLDNSGHAAWWPSRRWRLLNKKENTLDSE